MIFRNKINTNTQNDATREVKAMPRLSDGFSFVWKASAGISLIWTISHFFPEWGTFMYVLIGFVIILWSGNPLFKM